MECHKYVKNQTIKTPQQNLCGLENTWSVLSVEDVKVCEKMLRPIDQRNFDGHHHALLTC